MKRKLLSIVLALVLALGMATVAFAAGVDTEAALKAAVQTGGEIQLAANITLNEPLVINSNVTLDLNGNTLTAGKYERISLSNSDKRFAGILIQGSAVVTLKNGTLTSAYAGVSNGSYSSYVLLANGTSQLTLEDVFVTGQGGADGYVRASGGICYDSTGSLTLTRCSVTAGASNGKGYNYNNPEALYTAPNSAGTVQITNSQLTGGHAAGTKIIDCTGSPAINAYGSANINISGSSTISGGNSEKTAGNAVEARGSGKVTVDASTLAGGTSTDGIGGSALYVANNAASAEIINNSNILGGNGGTSWDGSGIEANKAQNIIVKNSTVKSGSGANATGNAAAITGPNMSEINLTLENTTLHGVGKNTVIKNCADSNTTLNGTLTIAEGQLKDLTITSVGENASIQLTGTASIDTTTVTTTDPDKMMTAPAEGGNTYTFDTAPVQLVSKSGTKTPYSTLEAAIAAAQDGDTIKLLKSAEYPRSALGGLVAAKGHITLQAAENVQASIDMSSAVTLGGAKVTFENMTFDYKTNGNYIGLQHADTLVYNNCKINGMVFLYAKSETFNSCVFTQESADAYNVWTYGAQNVAFNSCTFNCAGKSVLVYNEGTNTKTDLTVTDSTFTASAPAAGKAAIEIDTSLMAGGATVTIDAATAEKVTGFDTGSKSGSSLWNDKKQDAAENKNTTVTVAGETVFAPRIAQIGDTYYYTLDDAFAALNSTDHTLTLTTVGEGKWDAATPVYWKAGDQSGYAATLKAALEAAQTGTDDVLIVCRPRATIASSGSHYNVTNNVTIYANNADFGGQDLSIGTYVAPKNTPTTVNIYDAKNLVVWGQPVGTRADVWNINFVGCENDGSNFLMYRGGEDGKATLNATLTDCKATGYTDSIIHTTADGSIKITNCSFADNCAPVNIAHKQDGSMTVEIDGCTFTKCGKVDPSNNYFAPVRMVNNNASGTVSVRVKNTTFTGTIGVNGDILLGDGRKGKESHDVSATVSGTAATVVAQRPGHYSGSTTNANKQERKTLTADETLSTTLNEMLPIRKIDMDEFLTMLQDANYDFDGASVTGSEKLVVEWSPESGCFQWPNQSYHQLGENCPKTANTGNTPNRVDQDPYAQYQIVAQAQDLRIRNVNFVYVPAEVSVCMNGSWGGTKTPALAELQLQNSGNTTFENCSFDKVTVSPYGKGNTTVDANAQNSATFTGCEFANIENKYAIKDVYAGNLTVTDCTFTDCGGAIYMEGNAKKGTINISDNTFIRIGEKALLQFSKSGDYTDADITLDGNTATDCGPILRQLNESFEQSKGIDKVKGDLSGLLDADGKLRYTSDSLPKPTPENPNQQPPQPTIFTVTFANSDVPAQKIVSGTALTLPTAAKAGYTFRGWALNGTLYDSGVSYTVTGDVTFTAVWEEIVLPVTPVTPSEPAKNPFNENAGKSSVKFDDVSDNAWYASAVNYVVENGLMNGTGNGKFSPSADTTRGMIVTILARLNGKSTAGTPWYEAGRRWAMEYEISDGTNMTSAITREQLVTMLYRYAVKNGLEAVTLADNLSQFTDASSVSSWAVPAMQWAVGSGLMQGSNGQLRPQDNASRAEVAAMLMRFCAMMNK